MTRFTPRWLALAAAIAFATASAPAQQVVSIPKPVREWADIVNAAKPNTVFLLGPGIYHTSVPISITANNIVLAGAGARTTTIVADAAMPALINSTSRIISIRDIVVNANHMADVGIHAVMPTHPDTKVLEGVLAQNAVSDGIVIEACQLCTFDGVSSSRNGRDGIAGTADDVTVPDVKTFQAKLGIGDLAMKALGNQISLSDSNRRVESVGQAEGTQVMISVVTRLNASPVQYFLWSEQ